MKNFCSAFLVLFSVFILNAQTTKKALFIGNSYTASNNLPNLIAQMAESTADELIFDSNVPGGYTLKQHSTNATTLSKINQGDWDFVILQDQSQYPSLSDNFVQQNVYPYAEALNETILAANSCTETMFYATWGRKNGDSQNCANWPPVCTYEGMDDLLQERYRYMADENEALLSPVAWVWRYIRLHHPEIQLYTSDESHPSLAGSYAAAATFYTLMYEKNPEVISFNASLSADIASKIRTAVKNIVWNDVENWNLGKFDPQAEFSFSQTEIPLQIQFTNAPEFATEYLWDFGDGLTSTEIHPLHTYAQSGTYTVKLISKNCGKEAIYETVLETELNTTEQSSIKRNILPNPVENLLTISLLKPNESWKLYDANGKLIHDQLKSPNFDMRNLPAGIYFIQILTDQNQPMESIKFLKK